MPVHRATISPLATGPLLAALLLATALGFAAGCATLAQADTPATSQAPRAALPMDPAQAKNDWEIGSEWKPVQDDLLGQTVLEHQGTHNGWLATKAAITGPCEIVARLRFAPSSKARMAILTYGATGPSANVDGPYCLQAHANPTWTPTTLYVVPVLGSQKSAAYQNPDLRKDHVTHLRAPAGIWFRARFADISPVWAADFRQEIEASMAVVPPVDQQWFELRIVHTPQYLRMYKDGILVAERVPGGPVTGAVHLKLANEVRVAALEVRPLPAATPGYEVVPMEGSCNATLSDAAKGLAIDPASLPARGQLMEIGGVPLRLPAVGAGGDHLDIGASLFHYRNEQGHFMADQTWPAVSELDGARLRLTVPNRPYQRLWVLAACDSDPQSVPLFTARFYVPGAGFSIDAQANVPAVTDKSASGSLARAVPVRLGNGDKGNLWLVPVDLDAARLTSEMREQPMLSLELTKKVLPYRSYPDPANYNYFQGGLPSAVHILAMTLELAPIHLLAGGNRSGNAYVLPEQPVWQVALENLSQRQRQARIVLAITDPQGGKTQVERRISLPAGGQVSCDIPLTPRSMGLHQVQTQVYLEEGGPRQMVSRPGTFIQLPIDARDTNRSNTHWGLWTWSGGHGTNPVPEENLYLNRAAGAHFVSTGDAAKRRSWDVSPAPAHVLYGPEAWASEDPIDPAKYQEFADRIGQGVAKRLETDPDIPSFSIFTETAISTPLTYGMPPQYVGEGPYKMNDEEKKRFAAFMVTMKAASEGIRKHAPKAKIALGWCEPNFAVPFLEAGFPKEQFDLIGVDSPVFERTPEMPIREVAPNRMWLLKEAMKKHGYDKPIIHTESYYPTSHELALGFRGSADHTVRLAVLSLALESDILANCFTLHDTSSYWGSQHYGCIGIVGRRPEYNPKPAFAAFATMTRMIDTEQYNGFVPTGSHSAYCVRFLRPGRLTYCLWNVRGERQATLHFAAGAQPTRIDESGREEALALTDGAATVTLGQTPFWIRTDQKQPIDKITLGESNHQAAPGGVTELTKPHVLPLDDLAKPWKYDPADYPSYAQNHWGQPRYPGPMTLQISDAAGRGKVWDISLQKPAVERPLAAWYGIYQPEKPLAIPGKAAALGIWANGHSNWGRVVYEIVDAKGERWQSVGMKDDWNCDDTHTWSFFNFDGWRYLEFPLPNHQAGDNYREQDTVWWNFDAEGIVDLPVTLSRVIVELRTHNLYVDQLEEVAQPSVQLAGLSAVYESPEMAGEMPVKLQQQAVAVIKFPASGKGLTNPITELKARTDAAAAPKITALKPPEHFYDGTRIEVTLEPVAAAAEYRIYVSAYEDGRGAKPLVKGEKPVLLVTGLRPETPLFLFASYLDKDKKESQPSPGQRVLLKDDFPMK